VQANKRTTEPRLSSSYFALLFFTNKCESSNMYYTKITMLLRPPFWTLILFAKLRRQKWTSCCGGREAASSELLRECLAESACHTWGALWTRTKQGCSLKTSLPM
jgi:hypothetical protein